MLQLPYGHLLFPWVMLFASENSGWGLSGEGRNLYHVHQLTSTIKWNDGGIWVLGGRRDLPVTELDVKSQDNGKSLQGFVTYQGEEPLRLRTNLLCNNTYAMESQKSKGNGVWQTSGYWMLGGRSDKKITELKLKSTDIGKTYAGTLTYGSESSIRIKCHPVPGLAYYVETRSGTSWQPGGIWVLGARKNQALSELILMCDGNKLNGTIKYDGENSIGFKADYFGNNSYSVKNQCTADNHQWRYAGTWILGSRPHQKMTALYAIADLQSNNLLGNITYAGEDPIEFQATPLNLK